MFRDFHRLAIDPPTATAINIHRCRDRVFPMKPGRKSENRVNIVAIRKVIIAA